MANVETTPRTKNPSTTSSNKNRLIIINPFDNASSLISINTNTESPPKPCPTQSVIIDDGIIQNPNYTFWVRQDQLILSA